MNYNSNFRDIVYQLLAKDLRGEKLLSYLYSLIKPVKDLNSGISVSDYSASSTYAVGDQVRYDGCYYLCRIAIGVPEAFDETKWASLGYYENFYNLTQNIQTLLKFDSKQLLLEKYLNQEYDPTLSDFNSYDPINDVYYSDGVLLTNVDNKPRIQVLTATGDNNFIFNDAESATPVYLYNNWDTTVAYVIDDRVYYDTTGKVYKCILGHTGQAPTNTTYWTEESTITYYYNMGGGSYDYDFIIRVPTGLLGTREAEFLADIKQWKIAAKTYDIVTY